MKKFSIKKALLVTGAAMLMTVGTASIALAAGWTSEGGSWRYTNNSGSYVYNTWEKSGNDWFYLDGNGNMAVNQIIDDSSSTYYVNGAGAMVKNVWIEYDGQWYYFQDSGKAKSDGFLTVGNTKYHFSADVMETGWLDEGSDSYYLGDDGAVSVGWKYISDSDEKDEGWYYFESSGKLVTGKEKKIGSEYYVFDSNGEMLENWVSFTLASGSTVYKYYNPGSGNRASGWKYLEDISASDGGLDTDSGWYYFKNGIPYTANYKTTQLTSDYGVAKINNQIYCFDALGKMCYGTITDASGAVFYFGPEDGNGQMQTGKVTVSDDSSYDEETMYFNTTGGLGNKGSSYTGVKNGYLYDNGILVKADNDKYELVTVASKTYIVSEQGRVKESGTVKLDSDTKMKITKRSDGLGYQWEVVN